MVYDAAEGYVLLFGGLTPNNAWEFSGGVWTELTPGPGPSAREYGAMTYDPADGCVLLFGGQGTGPILNDTWEFEGGEWTGVTPTVSPPATYAGSLTYDAADGYAVLFGGLGSSGSLLNYTWAFKEGEWTNMSSGSSPPPRWFATMGYDVGDGYVLLFGGQGDSHFLNDTWEFKGGVWTELMPSTSPSARGWASMTYDAADGYVLLFGGAPSTADFPEFNDTWAFKGGEWTNLTPATSPSDRSDAAMVYDPADGFVMLYSGLGPYGGGLYDTWEFTILLNPGEVSPAFVAVDQGQSIVLTSNASYGVPPLSYQWYSGGSSNCSSDNPIGGATSPLLSLPSPASGYYCYQVSDREGVSGFSSAAEISVSSALVSGSIAPLAAVIDSGQSLELTANPSGGTLPYHFAWYAGFSPTCTSDTLLPGATNWTYLAGPTTSTYYCYEVADNATFPESGYAVAEVTVNAPLVVGSPTASRVSADVGESVTFTIPVSGGTFPYLPVTWVGLPSAGCNDANTTVVTCALTGSDVGSLQVWGKVTDNAGVTASSSSPLTFVVDPDPTVSVPEATPATLGLGGHTMLSVTATAGAGLGLTYAWFDLPPGCASSGNSTLVCTPSAIGTYSVTVVVTDSNGYSVMSSPVGITVVSPVPTPANSGGLNGLEWSLLGALVALSVVVAILLVYVFVRKGRKGPKGRV